MNKALIVVDMQNDFITGSLAVPGAQEIVGPIQDYVGQLRKAGGYEILFTRCWHPVNHCSFVEHGGKWPTHCVEHTWGAELQIGLRFMVQYMPWMWIFNKGMESNQEEYSAFNAIGNYLARRSYVTEVEVCGLARDYCVAATAADLEAANYKVTILEHMCRSVHK